MCGSGRQGIIDMDLLNISTDKDKIKVLHGEDITHVLKANQVDRTYSDEKWATDKTLKHAGRIPFAVWLTLEKQGITKDRGALLKWLELNPQYKATNKRLT